MRMYSPNPLRKLSLRRITQTRVFCATIYHLATPAMAALARTESIYKGEKFSDHAPITVEYEFAL